MSWFRAWAVALVWLVSLAPAWAHHGVANFDLNKEITITGTVTRISLVNPHSWLFLDAAGDDGRVVPWRCELRGATVLRRSGWSPDMFKAGTTITITGAPDRFEPNTCYLGSARVCRRHSRRSLRPDLAPGRGRGGRARRARAATCQRRPEPCRRLGGRAAGHDRPARHGRRVPPDWRGQRAEAGQRAGRHAGLPGHERHGRVACRGSDRRLLEPSQRDAADRRRTQGHRRIRRRLYRQSPAAMRADQHPVRLGVRDRREPHRADLPTRSRFATGRWGSSGRFI